MLLEWKTALKMVNIMKKLYYCISCKALFAKNSENAESVPQIMKTGIYRIICTTCMKCKKDYSSSNLFDQYHKP